MADLDDLTTLSALTQYRTDRNVDPDEQNDNEGGLRGKLNTVITALNDGSVLEISNNQSITGTKTFTNGIQASRVKDTVGAGNVYLGANSTANDYIANRTYVLSQIAAAATVTGVVMVGADGTNPGISGAVPAPSAAENVEVLKGDATWGLVDTVNIASSAITTAKIADGAITADKIADGTIIAADVMDNTLTTAKIISTSKTGLDVKLVTGTAGTADNLTSWNADGDAVDSGISITQARAGQLVKVTEATLGSDSTVTATSATASGLQINYTPISSTNDRYIEGTIDWQVSNATGNQAQAFAELQTSSDGSSWATVQTFTNNIEFNAGKKLVGSSQDTIPSDVSTTSTTLADVGLQVDYTSVGAANDRYIEFNLYHQINRNGTIAQGTFELQYSDNGSSWSVLQTWAPIIQVTGGSVVLYRVLGAYSYLHTGVSDATPQYRIQYKVNVGTASETLTVFATGAYLRVKEYALDTITTKRNTLTFRYLDTSTNATPFVRLATRVTSGGTSVVYTGSTMRISEYRDL